jgi:hypothetical protein
MGQTQEASVELVLKGFVSNKTLVLFPLRRRRSLFRPSPQNEQQVVIWSSVNRDW